MELHKDNNIKMFIDSMIISLESFKIIKNPNSFFGRKKLMKIQMTNLNNLCFVKIKVQKIKKMAS